MTRETRKNAGCLVAVLLLMLACGYSTRMWFDELETALTQAVHAAGYTKAEFRVQSTYFTPLLSTESVAAYRAEGVVTVAADHASDEESLSLASLVSQRPSNAQELAQLVPPETVYKVLYNPGLPRRTATFESPRVIPYQEDFLRAARLRLLGCLVKTLWPPALWALMVFLVVRHQTPRWKKQKMGLR